MKYIDLPNNKQTIVDDEDFKYLNQFRWNFNKGYVVRNQHNNCKSKCKGSGCKKVFMHHLVIGRIEGKVVDHINHNTLDNQKKNLRIVSYSGNQWNRKLDIRSVSMVTGVSFDEKLNKWRAYISYLNNWKDLGRFKSRDEAINARLLAERKYHKYGSNY